MKKRVEDREKKDMEDLDLAVQLSMESTETEFELEEELDE